jgi:hypothetical protein
MGEVRVKGRREGMMVLTCGAADWRVWGVKVGPPVIIRLPLAVYLTAASCTYGGEI